MGDDPSPTVKKSFELQELDPMHEGDGHYHSGTRQPFDEQNNELRPPGYSTDDHNRSESGRRTAIHEWRERGRSSPSVHAQRDRSSSAARPAATSYSRISLGSQSTEHLPFIQAPEHDVTPISKAASAILLVTSSLLVAVCAEFLINTVDDMVQTAALSEAFIGLIILPVVGNCAEHITAVTVAVKNKVDLAIGVSVGSAIQVGLVLTPLIVLVGWALNKEMTMYFSLFETVTLVATAFLVNFLILNGKDEFPRGQSTMCLLCYCWVS